MGTWAPQAECFGGSQWGPTICVGRKNLGLHWINCSECKEGEVLISCKMVEKILQIKAYVSECPHWSLW